MRCSLLACWLQVRNGVFRCLLLVNSQALVVNMVRLERTSCLRRAYAILASCIEQTASNAQLRPGRSCSSFGEHARENRPLLLFLPKPQYLTLAHGNSGTRDVLITHHWLNDLNSVESQLELVELGVVCCFIDLLSSSNQRLQFYAITALRNLSTFLGMLIPKDSILPLHTLFVVPVDSFFLLQLKDIMFYDCTAVIRREIMQEGGLEELLRLVHGPSRAAVSVARLEAMRTISNLSVTGTCGHFWGLPFPTWATKQVRSHLRLRR